MELLEVSPHLGPFMCGVAGIFDSKLPEEKRHTAQANMSEATRRRGPGEDGSFDCPASGRGTLRPYT